MKVLFRVDASVAIGTGHVMRCLTLAEEFRLRSAEVTFVSRNFPGNLNALIKEKGFCTLPLDAPASPAPSGRLKHASWLGVSQAQDADETLHTAGGGWDLLVVDHYGLDAEWQTSIRPAARKLFAIDDVADRHHDVDYLLDQNLYSNSEARYDGKVPDYCRRLLGPNFALLRKEFSEARKTLRKRSYLISNVLVFYGGADPDNQTMVALRALDGMEATVNVIAGPSNPNFAQIEGFCRSRKNFSYHRSVPDMASLIQNADISLGGGGTTTWERSALGLPAVVTILAGNQHEMTKEAERAGLQKIAGLAGRVTPELLRGIILGISSEDLRTMSERGLALVDALGASRVAEEVFS